MRKCVIISGAGPVGLFFACELALAKCSVLILEKAADTQSPLKKLPFGIRGLSAPTIEALDRRGLLKELEIHKHLKSPHQNAKKGIRRQVGHFAGIPFHDEDIDTAQWKYRLPGSGNSLISEMAELETVLYRRAEALGVEIRRGVAVTGFYQDDDSVTVQSGDRSFQCRWLVGCDGSRSVVRKLGGFEFAGTEPEFTGYTALMDIADPEKLRPGRNITPSGMDSYFTERHPIGAQVLDWSRAQVAIMRPDPETRALNAIFRDLMNTRDGATYFAGRVWGIFTHYDLGETHPLAGCSVPNFQFEDGTSIGEHMHDGHGILLDFDEHASLKTWTTQYGGRLRYISARPQNPLGLTALLIRPDGIVAWACDSDPDDSELQKAVGRWL